MGRPCPVPAAPHPHATLLLLPCGHRAKTNSLQGQNSSEQLQHRVGRLFQEAAASPTSSPREPSWKTPESGPNLLISLRLQPDLMLCRIGTSPHTHTAPPTTPQLRFSSTFYVLGA